MKISLFVPILVVALSTVSCEKSDVTDTAEAVESPGHADDQGSRAPSSLGKTEDEADHWSRVAGLYEKAKSSGETTAKSVGEWIAEVSERAKGMGAGATEDTKKWIEETYELARERGETTASSAKDWVQNDLGKSGSWKYKTVVLSTDDPEAIAGALNELGAERWECFWVDRGESSATFYLKKSGRSYLRNLPARELLRLLPLVGGAGGDSQE